MIDLKRVYLIDQDKTILKDITVRIHKNKRYLLLGPSGSGKTSLLKILNNLYSPTAGSVSLDNVNYCEIKPTVIRKKVGLIMQEPVMFGEYVYENFDFLSKILVSKPSKNKILDLLNSFGLNESFYNKRNIELSGGERYRISIIRTLLTNPEYILTDEPFAALDKRLMLKIFEYLSKWAKSNNSALIVVSHSFENIILNFNGILFMKDAKLIFQGKPDEFLNSENNTIKAFLEGNDE